eukprot:TRINITY_DN4090_c0_g1_i7.p1 TRINITY_DN4090_c0_g1~~TRINITY_DN4090_c0_g1_i7.p1  ORF type:complete len:726 (-),score=190.04 TRINITY_DN4090_c0_g1_i7:1955-4132(-)
MVARTGGSQNFVTVSNLENHTRVIKLPKLLTQKPLRCMAVIESDTYGDPTEKQYGDARLSVIVSTADGTLEVLSDVVESKWESPKLGGSFGAVDKIAVSPDCRKLAFFNDQGVFATASSSLKTVYSEFNTRSKFPPSDMLWCGNDAVLLCWNQAQTPTALLIAGDASMRLMFDAPMVHFVLECDGIRILTNEMCEFIQKVPKSTRDLFEIGSISPAAMLYDATEAFENRQARADESLRSIKMPEEMKDAILSCLDAAGSETDHAEQARLLKTASYGKLFLNEFNPQVFTDTCRSLRILNSVRYYRVGIPLTSEQYLRIGPKALVRRLYQRNHHLLALRICEYLHLNPTSVLIHWAAAKMNSTDFSVSDAALADMIVKKLERYKGVSYSDVAEAALKAQRLSLATTLLDKETRADLQVPLLISNSMQQHEIAMVKAIESGDTNLVYMVIMAMALNNRSDELFRMINDKPLARNLFVSYCKATSQDSPQSMDNLKRFYGFTMQPKEAAILNLKEAYEQKRFSDRTKFFDLARQFFAEEKLDPFYSKLAEEHLALMEFQRTKEEKHRNSGAESKSGKMEFIDSTISNMIVTFLTNERQKEAEEVVKKFKVPPRRFMHLQVKTLAELKRWGELANLAKSAGKNPIVGWHAFIDGCLAGNNPQEAAKYIKKLPDTAEQMEILCNIGLWNDAVEVAFIEKNIDALETISNACNDKVVQQNVVTKIQQLKSK